MRFDIIRNDVKDIVKKIDFGELKNKKILVTGASGLLGTYILFTLEEVIASGINIKNVTAICYSELNDAFKELMHYQWFKPMQGDLSDDSFINEILDYDIIIHAAGYGQPGKFAVDEVKTIKLNTTVTDKLFGKLYKSGKFLFISSSGIYNGCEKDSFTENDIGITNTIHPRACYIEGKRCGEAICNAYRKKGIDSKCVRLSYTYGPGVKRNDVRVLYELINKAISGKIELRDSGKAQRIYCYISDAVKMIFNVLLYGNSFIYNVGGDLKESISIYQMAELIGKHYNVEVHIPKIENSVPGNAQVERLSMNKYEQEFGKMEYMKFVDGLGKTIEWIESC